MVDPLTLPPAERWEVQCYESGTMIVRNMAGPVSEPHLYVYGPGGKTEDDCVRSRFQVCEDLAAFLNGGNRPAWLDDLHRVNERYAEAIDRTSIQATGPMYDKDPPKLHWDEVDTDDAKNARARLMDRLFGVEAKPCSTF